MIGYNDFGEKASSLKPEDGSCKDTVQVQVQVHIHTQTHTPSLPNNSISVPSSDAIISG